MEPSPGFGVWGLGRGLLDEMGVKPELMLRYLDAFKGYPPVAEQMVLFRTWLGDNESCPFQCAEHGPHCP